MNMTCIRIVIKRSLIVISKPRLDSNIIFYKVVTAEKFELVDKFRSEMGKIMILKIIY